MPARRHRLAAFGKVSSARHALPHRYELPVRWWLSVATEFRRSQRRQRLQLTFGAMESPGGTYGFWSQSWPVGPVLRREG